MTSDIHGIFVTVFQIALVVLSFSSILRGVCGPLPFLVSFGLVELFRVVISIFFGILNFSAFIQIAIIMDTRYDNNNMKEDLK